MMSYRTGASAFCLSIALLPGSRAPAQNASDAQTVTGLKSLSLEQLGNVEVTIETKEPTEVWNTPSAVYVLTADDIRRSGVTNIPDALRLVPGVDVARVSGSRNWVVAIRGLGDQYSKYVQVLIDGRSVYTPLFGGVFWSVDNVMLEDIDRIEVIRGPGGTIWGSDAVNGIINIITKSASETHGALLSTGGGSVDHNTESARYGRSYRGWNIRGFGFGFLRGPEYHQDGQPDYDWSRFGQLGFRSDRKRGHNELTFQGDAYLSKLGDAEEIPYFTPPSVIVSYAPTDDSGADLLGRWRRDLGKAGDLYLQAYWTHERRLGPNFGEVRNLFDVDFLQRTGPVAHQQFTYGAGVRVDTSTTRQVNQTLGFSPPVRRELIFSGFLQEEVHPLPDRLSFLVGSKFEHNTYTGFEYQPNGRILWTPDSRSTVWASVSRAVRIPDRVDEDLSDYDFIAANPLIFAGIFGNKNLRAERLVAYESGYRALLHRRLYLDVAGFRNQYHDLIAQGSVMFAPTPTPPVPAGSIFADIVFTNGIRGDTEGFEIAPDWKAASWWRFKAAYSYLHLHLQDQPSLTDTTTLTTLHGSSPNSEVSFRSLIDLPRHFELDQILRYVGPLPAQQVKAYVTADVRGGYHWRQFDVSLVGQNLLQPHHGEFGISPGPNVLIRRGVYAKLVWRR